jgi:CheY-like chemotaxis protein
MDNLQHMNEVDVLLVEDNPSDAELTVRALRSRNLANRLFHVKDGVQAIDFLFAQGEFANRRIENRPKLVLLDLKLPKMDGIEVLRRIKADQATRKIPVVMMTSSREERDVVESYRLGVNSYIVKPVDFDQFTESVCQLGMYWMLVNHSPTA